MKPAQLGKTLDGPQCVIAAFSHAPLFVARREPFELNQLAFQKGVEFFSLHVDLIGSVLDE